MLESKGIIPPKCLDIDPLVLHELPDEANTTSEKVYTIEELQELLYPVFVENKVRSAMLFGSYAKGEATSKSDVDLFVDSGLKGLSFIGLFENVRSVLRKEVDLIDVSHVEVDSKVYQEIMSSGIMIYVDREKMSMSSQMPYTKIARK